MNFLLYSYGYNCPRWYGNVKGFDKIVVQETINNKKVNKHENINDENVVKQLAVHQANKLTGSKDCNVFLLNKFKVTFQNLKTYPSLTGIKQNKPDDLIKEVEPETKQEIN